MIQPASPEDLERLLRSYDTFKLTYRYDPVAFVLDCFRWKPGRAPTPYQIEILGQFAGNRPTARAAVRGPHGLGKTAMASWIVLWFALTRDGDPNADWKIVTTASGWRQLTKFLWPEVHKWSRFLNWGKIGRPPFKKNRDIFELSMRLQNGEAFAAASDQPALIEGAHAERILYIFDESKTIRDGTFDAAEGALSGGGLEALALAISTPGEPVGRFYDIHARKPGLQSWWVRHVTHTEVIAAGRMSEEWRAERALQWGDESAIYKNRVLGEFSSSDADGLIPLAWVEKAIERWHTLHDSGELYKAPIRAIGVDVAREGDDRTAMAPFTGTAITKIYPFPRQDTMVTTGHVVTACRKHTQAVPIIDIVGLGAGVYDRCTELKGQGKVAFTALPFNAGVAAKRGDTVLTDKTGELEFINLRSAAMWHLRERLDPTALDPIALPPDDRLTEELITPRWKMGSSGKVQVESKDDIRKRINRSTDYADAVMMALAKGMIVAPAHGAPFTIGEGTSKWRI